MSFPPASAEVHAAIARWYADHGRHHLPWRQTTDPYAIYISEVMLQQTQVATVLSRYYFPFLERFPTLSLLADAPLEAVLKAWEGLGYYSRARSLHRAAQLAAPELPRDVEGLLALPGIGRNTAHAIAAFAYRTAVPVMEANVKRVLHRLHAREAMSDPELWDAAFALLDAGDPFTHNQAMMDIGSRICTPRAPACLLCPLNIVCQGQSTPERYPTKKIKKPIPMRQRRILALRNRHGEYFISPRKTKLLGGLYGFPELMPDGPTVWQGQHIEASPLGSVQWTYSHFRLEADVLHASVDASGEDWLNLAAIAALPLSGVDKKVLALIIGNAPKY